VKVNSKLLRGGFLLSQMLQSSIPKFCLLSLSQFPRDDELLLDSACLIADQLSISISKIEVEKAARFMSVLLYGMKKFSDKPKLIKDGTTMIKNYCKVFDARDDIINITDTLKIVCKSSQGPDLFKTVLDALDNITNIAKSFENVQRCVGVADELLKANNTQENALAIFQWMLRSTYSGDLIGTKMIEYDQLTCIGQLVTFETTERDMIKRLKILKAISTDGKALAQCKKQSNAAIIDVIQQVGHAIKINHFQMEETKELYAAGRDVYCLIITD
jgi:hypothetical protein